MHQETCRESLKTTADHYGTVPLRAPKRFHVRGMERSHLVPHSRRNNKNTTRGDRGSGSIRRGRGNVEQREGGSSSRAFFTLTPLEKSILAANSGIFYLFFFFV